MTKPSRPRRNKTGPDTPQTAEAEAMAEIAQAPAVSPSGEAAATTDRPLLLAAGDGLKLLEAALPGFTIRPVDLDALPDDALRRADLAPALALIAPRDRLDQARAFAEAAGMPDLAAVASEEATAALPAALAARLAAAESDAGHARRSTALLRRETEALSRRLQAVERFMYGIGGPRLSQALNWAPSDALARMGDGATLTQRLPIDSPGITAVDLWLPDADEDAARALRVVLADSEEHEFALTLDEVSLARDDGWLRFTAEEPIGGDRQDCRLILSGGRDGLGIGLGPVVADEDFALAGANGPEGDGEGGHTLALRIWRAVTGAALSAAEPSVGRGRIDGSIAQRLLPSELPRPSLLASPRSATDHVSTAFWAQEDAILVHPSARGPVCAILQRAPLAQVSRLSAVVQSARQDAPLLSFAIGVAPAGTVSEDDWDDYLGDWITLPPGSWGEVHASLGRAPLAGRLCDVILATSVAGGNDNNNAWALFRAFRVVRKSEA